jgi:hypothetical protein
VKVPPSGGVARSGAGAVAGAAALGLLGAAYLFTAVVGGAQEPGPPTLTFPFPASQAYRITCGYAHELESPTPTSSGTPASVAKPSPSPERASGCGHSGESYNRFALDLQYSGGSKAAINQPILAAAPGIVARADWHDGLGFHVILDHEGGYQTVYAHMIRLPHVAEGQAVERGAILGRVGSTGRSTGPHIHFVLWKDGVSVNPEPICGVRNLMPGMLLDGCEEAPLIVRSDFTGDTADDIVLLTTDRSGIAHAERVDFESERLTRFGPPTYLPQYLENLTDIDHSLTGDFDGDGVSDIALLVAGPGCWSRLDVVREGKLDLVNRKNWWGDPKYCANRATAAVAGDVTGDGLADIALLHRVALGESRIDVLVSDGDSFAQPETWWSSEGYFAGRVEHLASGDYNGDGTADLAALYGYDGCETRAHVFLSERTTFEYSGPGGWWQNEETCAERIEGIATADLDRDGRVDDLALVYRLLDGRTRIDSLAAGETSFEEATVWTEPSSQPRTVGGQRFLVAADIDGAPGADLAIARRGAYCKTILSVFAGDALATADPALAPEDVVMRNSDCAVTVSEALP